MTPISNDGAVVTAEHEVDHRLIFRAHLALAKWRLAAAVLVMGLLIASLIYFFVLIGEQKILWQTSPLFIGFPLLGIGGQMLRLHATSRKYVASLLPSQRVVRYAFRAEASAYEVLFGESYGLITWADHLKALEQSDYFLLVLNRQNITVIPKSAFEQHGISVFRNILKSKLGERAHVANR
jgi:hypothetical protein